MTAQTTSTAATASTASSLAQTASTAATQSTQPVAPATPAPAPVAPVPRAAPPPPATPASPVAALIAAELADSDKPASARRVAPASASAASAPAAPVAPKTPATPVSAASLAVSDDSDAPMPAMAVYFPHVLVSGHSSLIHVRLTNNQAYSLESIETTVETRGLAQPVRRKWPRIAPGQTRTEPLEIEPARPGRYVLRLTVSFEMGGQRYSCRGTHSLGVNQEPESHNISINIGDIQSSTGGGSNSNLGAEYGNVQISNLLGGANIRTLNELLDFVFPEKYVPVKMDLDYELSVRAFSDDANARRKGLLIPGPFLGHVQPGDYCVLRSTSGEERELRLVSRPALKLGRARADADYVTWFWPRSGLLDERTRRISKVHTSLAVSEQGILVWDEGTPNGTTLDGQPVGKKEIPGAISQRGLVMLGAEYGVTIEHQASAQPSGPCVKNEQHWPGPPLAAQPPVMSGAVKFSPEEGSASPFSAVWLLTDASFGTSGSNTVVLADIALDEIQGRFHHYRGCFWVENSVANRAVAINGQTLTSGAMAPLSSGMELRIGGQAWRVEILST